MAVQRQRNSRPGLIPPGQACPQWDDNTIQRTVTIPHAYIKCRRLTGFLHHDALDHRPLIRIFKRLAGFGPGDGVGRVSAGRGEGPLDPLPQLRHALPGRAPLAQRLAQLVLGRAIDDLGVCRSVLEQVAVHDRLAAGSVEGNTDLQGRFRHTGGK
jgi:hypothetical protein